MAPLGPFEPAPHLAVAVSGGADSMALALLSLAWVRTQGGRATALVVDHGLRPDARAEAEATLARLDGMGLAAELLTLPGLLKGPGLAARARTARHAALAAAARRLGVLHLLLGHHAGDQAETVAMRRLAGSYAFGLAGMAALAETEDVRLLRPLLTIPPGRLRATLRQAGIGWVEDPSNADPSALRARLREARGDAAGDGVLTRAAVVASIARGRARGEAEGRVARELAASVQVHPEGYAVLGPEGLSAAALAALLRTLSGASYAPAPGQVAALAACLRPATLGGVRVLKAGRLGPGWLLVREPAALGPPVPARRGAVWDGRYRLAGPDAPPDEARAGASAPDGWAAANTPPDRPGPVAPAPDDGPANRWPAGEWIAPLGAGARALPAARAVPAIVLETLPSLWRQGELVGVPHLGYPFSGSGRRLTFEFVPSLPLAGAPFAPAPDPAGRPRVHERVHGLFSAHGAT